MCGQEKQKKLPNHLMLFVEVTNVVTWCTNYFSKTVFGKCPNFSTGLSQLPLMMALVKIQGADVELCNAEGFTALMLAASAGNCVLCDVSGFIYH